MAAPPGRGGGASQRGGDDGGRAARRAADGDLPVLRRPALLGPACPRARRRPAADPAAGAQREASCEGDHYCDKRPRDCIAAAALGTRLGAERGVECAVGWVERWTSSEVRRG